MPRSNSRSQKASEWGVMEMARERPVAAAAAAAGAAAAGLFLWSKRNQISNQINSLSDQIGEWTESMTSSGTIPSRNSDQGARMTGRTSMRSGAPSPSSSTTSPSGTRGRKGTGSRARGTRKTAGASASPDIGASGLPSINS